MIANLLWQIRTAMEPGDSVRAVGCTMAAACFVFGALSLYTPVSQHWQHGWQRHAAEIAPPEIWQRVER